MLCLLWTHSALYDWLSRLKLLVLFSLFLICICCFPERQRTFRLDKDATSELPIMTEQVKRVAIIGGGTSGLAALKTFLYDIPKPDGQRWEIELFERRDDLGGIWSVLALTYWLTWY